MIKQVMILGAAGNFGSKIANGIAKANIPLILVGRQEKKLQALKFEIQQHSKVAVETVAFDVKNSINNLLNYFKPFIVINTCGPFQTADYSIALSCIHQGIHYIDLADNRSFVNGIHTLDHLAKANHCLVVSGASTVPCLSSAVLEHYKNEFITFNSLLFGITPGQKTTRGLATTKAILSYLGKPLPSYAGSRDKIYGWQNLYTQTYPDLGKRWMANCDIPDLDLLPKYYGLQSIRFSAGMESSLLHLSMWLLSWLIRLGLPINLTKHAKTLLKCSHLFDYFGSNAGGMHMIFTGMDKNNQQKTIKWFLIAKNGDGPNIPTIPAIVLTKKLIQDKLHQIGAMPCINLISLEEYLKALQSFDIRVYSEIC